MLTKTITTDLLLGMVSFLTALTLSACGARDRDGRDNRTASPETKDQVCRNLIDSYNSSTAKFVARTQTYKVERHFQRAIRKDCQGQVTSDKIETVQSPHVQFRLLLPKPREFKSVFLFNETSCDHVFSGAPKEQSFAGQLLNAILPFSPINGDGKSYIDVNGDVATALLTFEMAKGPNVVFAEYHYDCMPKSIKGNVRVVRDFDEKQSCDASADKHIVMYPIMINYEEKTLPGTMVAESNKEVCDRESQTKK